MVTGTTAIREVVDAGVSECPYCRAKQREPRTWWQCGKCKRLFPAATWLFEGYSPDKRERIPEFERPNESFTTALFALYLLHPDGDKSFPVRVVDHRSQCKVIAQEELGGIEFRQLGVELSAKPDLIIHRSDKVLHIENKFWARGGGENSKFKKQLPGYREQAAKTGAQFYVLVSCGNAQDELWKYLADEKIPILLWEEVFLRMEQVNFAVHLAPTRTLKPYYQTYLYPPSKATAGRDDSGAA